MQKRLYLVDPTHTLPMPGRPGTDFSPDGEIIDDADAFWLNLIADGSLTATPPAGKPAAPAAKS